MNCSRCGGKLMFDGLEVELRCLQCGRPVRRRLRPDAALKPRVGAFRRKWDVAPEELIADCGS